MRLINIYENISGACKIYTRNIGIVRQSSRLGNIRIVWEVHREDHRKSGNSEE